ncbi:zinc finger protein 808-like isoform X2 [Plodia interpunctella]|nr:zinc finger protein 808-like isoform X2 [Plodia interpunctella]
MAQPQCEIEYTSNVQLFNKIQTPKVCVSCLSQNAPFVYLSTCKHTRFFEYFLHLKIEFSELMVCTLCHFMLKKMEIFREESENNFAFLNTQCTTLLRSSKPALQATAVHTTDSTEPIQEDVCQDFPCDDFVTEVKIEHESDVDVPLSEIKKEIKGKSKNKKKVKKTKVELKYDGKVRVVHLTEEEMWSERERDRNRAAFLKLPYRCDDCITGFDHEMNLKDHAEKRHGKKNNNFVCKVCKSVLGSEHSFKEHVKRHYKRYECSVCGKRNNTVYSVVTHYKEQHGVIDAAHTCRDCGFTTDSHRSYRYHRDKHKPKQQCALCSSTFVNAAGLRVHMYTVHKQSERVFSCEACNKVYASSSGLAAHAQAAHRPRRAFCARCQLHFTTRASLAHHLQTHSKHGGDSNKVTCDECGGRFRTKTALLEHIDFVHLKKNKYLCGRCSK